MGHSRVLGKPHTLFIKFQHKELFLTPQSVSTRHGVPMVSPGAVPIALCAPSIPC